MATTPYKPTSWGLNEQITREKLNQMCANEQWIFENQPNVFYNAHGIKKTSGLKIMAGVTSFGSSRARHLEKDVYFGNFFSVGCRPIVIATPIMIKQSRLHVMVRGPGNIPWPDHTGFRVILDADEISQKTNYFWYASSVHFIALGY